jgi:hypothetical protein
MISHHSQVQGKDAHLVSMSEYFRRQHGRPITEENLLQIGEVLFMPSSEEQSIIASVELAKHNEFE